MKSCPGASPGAAVFIGIGANLPGPAGGDSLATCRWAAGRLDRLPGVRLAGLSRWFRTRPVPESDQPDFVNGVAQLRGMVDPDRLLADLHALEAEAGRIRGVRNAARTLDLDILAIGGMVRDMPDPVLPHPRLHERAFVLAPLHDLAPGWRHPVLDRTVAELLAHGFPDQSVQPIGLRSAASAPI